METGMPEDNLSKRDWKSSLEDVSIMSDELLTDKNATWKKLYGRLSNKSRCIKAVWYWIAAACLLTVIIVPVVMPYKFPGEIVKTNVLKIPLERVVPLMHSKKGEIVTASPSATRHPIISAPPIQIINKKSLIKKGNREQVLSMDINSKKIEKEQPAIIATDSVDRIESIAIVPLNKKLRVVHINELDPEESTTVTQSDVHPSLQLKFINPETYTSFSLPATRTGFTILKQKQAPSN